MALLISRCTSHPPVESQFLLGWNNLSLWTDFDSNQTLCGYRNKLNSNVLFKHSSFNPMGVSEGLTNRQNGTRQDEDCQEGSKGDH